MIAAVLLYQVPSIRENVDWRIANFRTTIKYAISPPEEAVFTPNPTVDAILTPRKGQALTVETGRRPVSSKERNTP